VREKLRRLSALGPTRPATRPRVPPPSGEGEGVEVIRARFSLAHRHGSGALGEYFGAIDEHDGCDPAQTLWLDTETTGLAGGTGTYVFLVGLASLQGASLVVEQILLRRLSAEGRFLTGLQERLARTRHLVTFNGQRFDWPMLEARFILNRLRGVTVDVHTDLIHTARRLWHRVLGTHRLGALETEILGAPREGDIPGWEIPGLYVHYLRTAERGALEPVLAHNRADLLALIGLHAAVAQVLRDPSGSHRPIDWEGAGVLLARRGKPRQAVSCFERALGTPQDFRDRWRILRRCVRQYRLLGETERVHERWEQERLAWRAPDRYRARLLLEVTRARERAGDRAGALAAAAEALHATLESQGHGISRPPDLVALLRRKIERLAGRPIHQEA